MTEPQTENDDALARVENETTDQRDADAEVDVGDSGEVDVDMSILLKADPATEELFRDGVWHAPQGRLTRIVAIAILMLILGSIGGLIFVLFASWKMAPQPKPNPLPLTPAASALDKTGTSAKSSTSDVSEADLVGYWIFDSTQIDQIVEKQNDADADAARNTLTLLDKAMPMLKVTKAEMTMFLRMGSSGKPAPYKIISIKGRRFVFNLGGNEGSLELFESHLELRNSGQTVPIPMRRMTINEEKQYTQ